MLLFHLIDISTPDGGWWWFSDLEYIALVVHVFVFKSHFSLRSSKLHIIFEHYLQNNLFRTKAVILLQWPIGLVGSSKASCHIWGTGNSDLRSSTLLCCFYCAMLLCCSASLASCWDMLPLCGEGRDRIKVIEVFCQVICRTVNWVGLGGIQHE